LISQTRRIAVLPVNPSSGILNLPVEPEIDLNRVNIYSSIDSSRTDSIGNFSLQWPKEEEESFIQAFLDDTTPLLAGYRVSADDPIELNTCSTALAIIMSLPWTLNLGLEAKKEAKSYFDTIPAFDLIVQEMEKTIQERYSFIPEQN
jgi:hypothetical protein